MKTITFVCPAYNEEPSILEFHKELLKVQKSLSQKYNVKTVYINDGSRDKTGEILHDIAKTSNNISVINMSRNFGHQAAITAGMNSISDSDAVIIIDSDLQDPPSVSLELVEQWEKGYDVVYAQRRSRKDTFIKKLTAHFFYRFINSIASIKIPVDTGDFRLIDRKVLNALKLFPERNRFTRGLISYMGFKQIGVLMDRNARFAGKSVYTIKKMMQLATDGIYGFSYFPLTMLLWLGGAFTAIGIVYLLAALILGTATDWQGTNGLILFVGGVNLLGMGIIGQYLARTYEEARQRPYYIIESEINHEKEK